MKLAVSEEHRFTDTQMALVKAIANEAVSSALREYTNDLMMRKANLPAGYRILAPGELDAETLEKAARVVEDKAVKFERKYSPFYTVSRTNREVALALMDQAAAIRSLKGGSE